MQATRAKSREKRARRAAERQGLALRKSRRRDPRARDFGELFLARADGPVIGPFGDLSEVERWLDADPDDRPYADDALEAWRAA